jgi:NADH dehydrogenase
MATISRFRAVVSVGRLRITGFPAWVMWMFLHLLYITGFKQQVSTVFRWFLTFISNGRSERTTTNQQLVGRLALERLGPGVSGPLVRGEPLPESRDVARQD